ncbi:uncharacterized protein LOC144114172 [Amblyomma americanum]|uniref:Uncharacterized protein n=1 Tax=Amblyomma americanum TaxID=6943 RepID=A0AAQ4DFY3_AMBAM
MQARRGGLHTASRAAPCISIAPGPAAAAGPNGSQTPWYRLGAPLSRPPRLVARQGPPPAGPPLSGQPARRPPSSPGDDGRHQREVFRPEGSLSGRGRVAWVPQDRREAFLHGEAPPWRAPVGTQRERSASAPAVRTANSRLRGERRSHCQVFHA